MGLKEYKVIAFSHRSVGLEAVGAFHIEPDHWQQRLEPVKAALGIDELMLLSTCNRVEWWMVSEKELDAAFLFDFFTSIFSDWDPEKVSVAARQANVFQGPDAVRHFFRVAASLDSLVIGEREIITQVRQSYDRSQECGLTGDLLRIAVRKTIETAKQVYTETEIATRQVSVVNLAFRQMRDSNVSPEARVLMIGAGQTNAAMARKMKKHGFSNFTIFNRSLKRAEDLVEAVGGKADVLTNLENYQGGFDVLISCTAATDYIVTSELYTKLLNSEEQEKVLIDLAIPNDIDREVTKKHRAKMIAISDLQSVAQSNLKARKMEIDRCETIIEENIKEFVSTYRARKLELSMKEIPQKVKEIRNVAVNDVFSKDLAELDDQSRETLEKVIAYMEKKYISVPMKMAREILLGDNKR